MIKGLWSGNFNQYRLFLTSYTWVISACTRLLYALKVINNWHVHALPSGLTQPLSAQRKISLGKEPLAGWRIYDPGIFCIGLWLRFLYPNLRSFKRVTVDSQHFLKVISRWMKINTFASHQSDTWTLLREGGHMWPRPFMVQNAP